MTEISGAPLGKISGKGSRFAPGTADKGVEAAKRKMASNQV